VSVDHGLRGERLMRCDRCRWEFNAGPSRGPRCGHSLRPPLDPRGALVALAAGEAGDVAGAGVAVGAWAEG
jgi:hypothetical protein